jgi:hypothetical protein
MEKTLDMLFADSRLGDCFLCRFDAELTGRDVFVPETPLADSGHHFKSSERAIHFLIDWSQSLLQTERGSDGLRQLVSESLYAYFLVQHLITS